MISSILTNVALLSILTPPPMETLDRVFSPDATITHGGTPNSYEMITEYNLDLLPGKATFINTTGANLAAPAAFDIDSCSCTDPQDIMLASTNECPMQGLHRNCGGAGQNPLPCIVPYPSEISDWQTLYETPIGVEIDYYDLWKWPRVGNTIDDQTLHKIRQEYLIYLQAEFQIMNKYLLRDSGLKVLIQHVHFMSYNDLQQVPNRGVLWETNLAAILPYPPHKPSPILHMDLTSGNGNAGTCRDNVRVHPAIGVRWDFRLNASQDTNCYLRGIIHELTHSLFYIGHTMCYAQPWSYDQELYGFFYAEQWSNTTPGCWAGQDICPAYKDISYQSYSWPCYENNGIMGNVCPRPRVGPFLESYPVDFDPNTPKDSIVPGQMRRQIRYNLLQLTCHQDCLTPIGSADLLDPTDSDGDEIPDWEDNCKFQLNNAQMDLYSDGIGNACDGCSITQPKSAAWILLLPILILLKRRNHGS